MNERTSPQIDDVIAPKKPKNQVDFLIEYIDSFYQRKEEIKELVQEAQKLKLKEDVINLGFEILQFRMELDEWIGFSGQLLEKERANQLLLAHDEQAQEAKGRGSSRPSSEIVKAQAGQYLAPLKRVHEEFKQTQSWMSNILSWCQSLQKMMQTEEYGELFSASNKIPEHLYQSPPSPAEDLKKDE